MGNNNSTTNTSTDLIDTSIPVHDDVFKVDNINSCGRKHASAKIHVSNDSLCIRQKHRQPLHIPLETIKRYGLDGSIFIIECGRRAPLGPARYAFRCKQAHRLVDCLDQRITIRSKQMLDQQRHGTVVSASSTLTNVSSASHPHPHPHHHHHHLHYRHHRRRRTQSDQGIATTHQAASSILFSSSSSSSVSLSSRDTFSFRNSEPNLSENYVAFDRLPFHQENNSNNNEQERKFIAKLKPNIEREMTPDLNYAELKLVSTPISSFGGSNLSNDLTVPIATAEPNNGPVKESGTQPSCKRALLSFFNPHQQLDANQINTTSRNNSSLSPTTINSTSKSSLSSSVPYVYIDHEKTTTLKDIVNERIQQQQARRVEV